MISMVKTTTKKNLGQPYKKCRVGINFLLRGTENKDTDTQLQLIHSQAQLS